jgi:hypothetical protein
MKARNQVFHSRKKGTAEVQSPASHGALKKAAVAKKATKKHDYVKCAQAEKKPSGRSYESSAMHGTHAANAARAAQDAKKDVKIMAAAGKERFKDSVAEIVEPEPRPEADLEIAVLSIGTSVDFPNLHEPQTGRFIAKTLVVLAKTSNELMRQKRS